MASPELLLADRVHVYRSGSDWDVTSNLANTRAVPASFAGTVNPVPLINEPLVPDRNWPGGFRRIRAD